MTLLISGVLLFAIVHFIPSLAPSFKQKWLSRLGESGYKGCFSLLLLVSLALIVVGWRSADAISIYLPVAAIKHPALVLLFAAFVLMVVSSRNSRLRRLIRHPQLSGVVLWAIAHLLLNGDNRSIILFGGLGLWAAAEIIAINKREGAWIKHAVPTWGAEFLTLLIAAAIVALLILVHPYLAGVPVV